MRVAVTVGVVSVVGAALMIRSAMVGGFGFFVAPIVLAELVFLGAVYLVWRGLGGGEPEVDRPEWSAPGPRRAPEQPSHSVPVTEHRLGGRSLVGRTGTTS